MNSAKNIVKMLLPCKDNVKNQRGNKRRLESSDEENFNMNVKKLKTSSVKYIINSKNEKVDITNKLNMITEDRDISSPDSDTLESFRCRKCCRWFSVLRNLTTHNCARNLLKCVKCPSKFLTLAKLDAHMKSHKTTTLVGALTSTKSDLPSSLTAVPNLFTCLCGISSMEHHYIKLHKLFDCQFQIPPNDFHVSKDKSDSSKDKSDSSKDKSSSSKDKSSSSKNKSSSSKEKSSSIKDKSSSSKDKSSSSKYKSLSSKYKSLSCKDKSSSNKYQTSTKYTSSRSHMKISALFGGTPIKLDTSSSKVHIKQ